MSTAETEIAKQVERLLHTLGMISLRDCECDDDNPVTCTSCMATAALVAWTGSPSAETVVGGTSVE